MILDAATVPKGIPKAGTTIMVTVVEMNALIAVNAVKT